MGLLLTFKVGLTVKAKTGVNPMNQKERETINSALSILDKHLRVIELTASNASVVKNYLRLKLELVEHEVFAVLFLDNAHQLIDYTEMFTGTINEAAVYPREVAKRALIVNAAAVILAHNHPSGLVEPSQSDIAITSRLKEALSLFEISILDHIIVGKGKTSSFAERGLL
jgi:DNA repair protein RadC